MAACMDAGVAIVLTDAPDTPSGLVLPFHRHRRQGLIARRARRIPRTLRVSQPTAGKSVGKPRLAGSVTQPGEKPTTGKSVGKPRLFAVTPTPSLPRGNR